MYFYKFAVILSFIHNVKNFYNSSCFYIYYIKNFSKTQISFYGRGGRARTCGLMVPNHAIYQLIYAPLYRIHQWRTLTSSPTSMVGTLFIYTIAAASIYVICLSTYMHLSLLAVIKLRMAMVATVGIEPTNTRV